MYSQFCDKYLHWAHVTKATIEMNQLKEVVNAVLEQQKLQLAPSTYDARKNYLKHLVECGDCLGISLLCQELYDSYVTCASPPDLRFQLLHAVLWSTKKQEQKLLHRKGSSITSRRSLSTVKQIEIFKNLSFPVKDGRIDTGHLIRRAEKEMTYLNLSTSTRWQYM